MARRTLLAAGLAVVALYAAGTASAEMYRWVDEQGQLHFTSDESKVPPRYRGQAEQPPASTGATVNRPESRSDAQPGTRDTGEDRLERLRRENRKAARKKRTPRRSVSEQLGRPEPKETRQRKYLRDCTNRNANGRCGRVLNPNWQPSPPASP